MPHKYSAIVKSLIPRIPGAAHDPTRVSLFDRVMDAVRKPLAVLFPELVATLYPPAHSNGKQQDSRKN